MAGVAVLLSTTQAWPTVEIKYSPGVTPTQRERLAKDIAFISAAKLADPSGELRRILKLPDLSAKNLEAWLQTRTHYIIDENYPLNDLTVFALARVNYPASGSSANTRFPEGVSGVLQAVSKETAGGGGTPLTPQEHRMNAEAPPAANDNQPVIIMGNMGSAFYSIGRQNQVLVGFNLLDEGVIQITSPRVGLFQIGRGLFMPLSPSWPQDVIENFVHTMYRLDTLFHEARHGDGSAKQSVKQLGFAHEVCPEGHEFAGFAGCDRPSNGPYRVGSLIMKAAIDGCGSECTARDKEILTILYADSMSRLLTAVRHVAGPAQDGGLCARLLQMRPTLAFCQADASADVAGTLEWDDAFEQVDAPTAAPAGGLESMATALHD